MSTSNPLVLKQKSGVEDVEVHPLVLFNILDHFIRRNDGQVRAPKDPAPPAATTAPRRAPGDCTQGAAPQRCVSKL